MADQRDTLAAEKAVAGLLDEYDQAQREIAQRVLDAVRSGDVFNLRRRRLQLAAVLAVLDQLGARTDPKVRELIADAYAEGADNTVKELNRLQLGMPNEATFAAVSVESVKALQDEIVGRLSDARRTIGRSVRDTYAKAGRRATLRSLLGVTGSPRSAAKDLAADLLRDREIRQAVERGGAAFVDKAGKRWALHTYAEMAARTTIRQAAVEGALNRMAAHGIDLARVSSHANACKICLPFQGRLVSLDGETTDYMGEAVMDTSRLPPFHPRCRHSLAPVATRVEALRRELAEAA